MKQLKPILMSTVFLPIFFIVLGFFTILNLSGFGERLFHFLNGGLLIYGLIMSIPGIGIGLCSIFIFEAIVKRLIAPKISFKQLYAIELSILSLAIILINLTERHFDFSIVTVLILSIFLTQICRLKYINYTSLKTQLS